MSATAQGAEPAELNVPRKKELTMLPPNARQKPYIRREQTSVSVEQWFRNCRRYSARRLVPDVDFHATPSTTIAGHTNLSGNVTKCLNIYKGGDRPAKEDKRNEMHNGNVQARRTPNFRCFSTSPRPRDSDRTKEHSLRVHMAEKVSERGSSGVLNLPYSETNERTWNTRDEGWHGRQARDSSCC